MPNNIAITLLLHTLTCYAFTTTSAYTSRKYVGVGKGHKSYVPIRLCMVKTELETVQEQQSEGLKSTIINDVSSVNGVNTSNGKPLDPQTYENQLIQQWAEDDDVMTGFDWEMEKLRRHFAGLKMLEDGTWVKRPGMFDFLANTAPVTVNERGEVDMSIESSGSSSKKDQPRPVTAKTIVKLFTFNILTSLGFGPALGMAAVPDAVIQKYEGSFLSFITGVLGGDLQTLAGGPLFLLLAKYYQDYGPIFNLSFGPKSFLVVSDPVMAKHILKSSPDAYCKGMLAEILEPIMGKGLIPADPETWKVSAICFN